MAENSELPAGTYIGILTAVGLLVSLLASKVFPLAQCLAMLRAAPAPLNQHKQRLRVLTLHRCQHSSTWEYPV